MPLDLVDLCQVVWETEHISVIVRLLATKKNDDEERQMLNFFDLLLFNDLLPAFDANITFRSRSTRSSSLKIWAIQVFYTFNNYRKSCSIILLKCCHIFLFF